MDFKIFDLGLVEFTKAWQVQKEIFLDVKNGSLNSALILARHYPVITLGRNADRKNILIPESELKTKGIKVYEIERGGDVTYHGPGQLIAYPVFNLNSFKKDIHWFLRKLEEVIIDCLFDFRVNARRMPPLTGVWVGKQKIASIGIAIRSWITFHGLSINIKKNDLDNFNLIRPCGLDVEMAALEEILDREIEINDVQEKLMNMFKSVFLTAYQDVCV